MINAKSNTMYEKQENWIIGNSNVSWERDSSNYLKKQKDTKKEIRNIKESFCGEGVERIIDDYIFKILQNFDTSSKNNALEEEIEHSKYILNFEEDWDDEGASKYKPETWNRGIKYLKGHARWLKENRGISIDTPKISHGPDGSVDILWETEAYKLLLNIPEDINKKATFYGEDKLGFNLEGELNTDLFNEGLTLWLENKEAM